MDLEEAYFEKLNGQMSISSFVEGPTAESFYLKLANQVRKMEVPGDSIPVFDMRAGGAWNQLWSLYQRMLERSKRPPAPAQISRAVEEQALEAEWSTYLNNRVELCALARRGALSQDLAAYLGLKPDDLTAPCSASPVDRNGQEFRDWMATGGRRADWRAVAHRCALARENLENMPADERRQVPLIMAARRADEAREKLEAEVAEIRAEREAEKAERAKEAIDIPAFI